MSDLDLIPKVAEAIRILREDYDLPDSSATDEYVAKMVMEVLRELDLAIVDLATL